MNKMSVPDDTRRRQFFTVPSDDASASRGAPTSETSLQRTTLLRTAIMKKTRCDMSISSNSFDPLITTALRVDRFNGTSKLSHAGDVRHSSLPPHTSLGHPNRFSRTTPTLHRQISENAADFPQTCGRPELSGGHESASAHIKTLRLSELCPGVDGSPLRHRTVCASSVHWSVNSHHPVTESSPDSDKVKAGRRLTNSSHTNTSSSRQEGSPRSKRDRRTKPDHKLTSSAGETTKRSANSSSKLCLAIMLLCLVIPLGYLLLHTAQNSPHMHRHELNTTSLDANLHKRVFGQHIALNVISKALVEYMSRQKPRKPLVLSFHGWTGVGKNHVVNIIAEELDPLAVHKIIMPLHSARYADEPSQRLTYWVSSNLANPYTVLFVIDELSKASPEFLLGLYDLLSNWQERIPVRSHVAVILLSNTGGTAINDYVYKSLGDGRPRESITHHDVIAPFFTTTFHNTWLHRFIANGLIAHIVPFLPLDRSHVVECIEAYMRTRRMVATASVVDRVLAELRFFPGDWPVFSTTGCRQVAGKVDLIAG